MVFSQPEVVEQPVQQKEPEIKEQEEPQPKRKAYKPQEEEKKQEQESEVDDAMDALDKMMEQSNESSLT